MAVHIRPWTPEEDARLGTAYAHIVADLGPRFGRDGWVRIGMKLGRSPGAVEGRYTVVYGSRKRPPQPRKTGCEAARALLVHVEAGKVRRRGMDRAIFEGQTWTALSGTTTTIWRTLGWTVTAGGVMALTPAGRAELAKEVGGER